ncbi:hypothetical protein D1007_51016 [Hordeum vulgare]|nr:hypothetical protein D1007_51016 [Hordeum vulgare]
MRRKAPAGAQKPRARYNKLGARSDTLSRAVYLGRPLPRAAHSSARTALSPLLLLRTTRAGAGALAPMDVHTGTPLTPLYNRDPPPPPPATVAVAENPSVGSVGVATAGAPSSVGLARSLFLPPRMTMATGGVASAPSRAAAAPSKLPNAARPKKGKTSAKKNKAVDGSGSSKARGKKLAGRRTGAAATKKCLHFELS